MRDKKPLFVDDLIEEIQFDTEAEKAGCTRVLKTLSEHSQDFGRVMPPTGYEDQLLRSLRKKVETRSSLRRFWHNLLNPNFALPRWSMGLTAVLAISVSSYYVVQMKPTVEVSLSSVLMDQLEASDDFFAHRWLASVGEPNIVARAQTDDPILLAMEMGSGELRKALTDLSGLVPGQGSK
ncbi:hypothetical protein GW915_09395 [bacterium]|nr:hypothetical protein [bacterium]